MICMSPLSRRRVVTARGTQGYFSPSPSQEVKEAAHSCAVEEGAGVGGQYPPPAGGGRVARGTLSPPARPGRGGSVPLDFPTPTSPSIIINIKM